MHSFFWHLANTGGPAPLFSAHGAVRRKKKTECVSVRVFFQYNDGCIPVRSSGSEWAGVEDSCIEPWGAVSPPQGL